MHFFPRLFFSTFTNEKDIQKENAKDYRNGHQQFVLVFDTNIKVGDVVQIIDGAFMGQEGRVVEIENNKVKIMINMFGSETAAELELYQIAEL